MADTSTRQPAIDIFGYVPSPERIVFDARSWLSDPGFSARYGARWARHFGLPESILGSIRELPEKEWREQARELLAPYIKPPAGYVAEIRAAGVGKTVLHGPIPVPGSGYTNDDLAAVVHACPDDLIGFARVDPHDPNVVREIERCAKDLGFRGITLTPFWARIEVTDEICAPILETCGRLGLVAWIHNSINLAPSYRLSYEHPLHLDVLASRYPDLRLISGHGGWPWIADIVAAAWRHPNLYVDTSTCRPFNLAKAGTGWELLYYFMQRQLQGSVLFGSEAFTAGRPLADLVDEAYALELKPGTVEKYMHDNAARMFGFDN